jgi:DNA (cytosine-5)-methyltransferase 1
MSNLRVLDAFAGIGGFSLGLERAGGFETVRAIEFSPDAQGVLRRNLPSARIDADIRNQDFKEGEADVVCAGFPCQDISQMGPRTGLSGARSGLFWEAMRAVRVVRPGYVLLENVVALLRRGMGAVLGALAASGYDAEWDCIPKAHLGAPDIRDRVWILAHPQHTHALRAGPYPAALDIAGSVELFDQQERLSGPLGAPLAAALARLGPAGGRPWDAEPQLSRVADGLPADVAAVKLFGNAVCPRIPEAIGRAIQQARAA